MNLSSRNLFKLAILAFMMTDFALLACKTSVSKTKDSGSADPVCFANYGSGYGQIYQCGDKYCAKQHPDYTVQCVVDNADPCHGVAVSSASSGESVDTSQPVWDVGSGMYFNACTANGGQGYGTPWSCGNAQCANVTAASPSFTFCRVSGGSLVPTDQVSSKLQTVATSDQQTQECTARANKQSSASSASASASPAAPSAGPTADLAQASFWDGVGRAGNGFVAHVTTPGTCVDVGIQAKSSTLDSLKDGYKFTVKFTDGSSDSGTQVGQLDDLTSRYPGLTVKCVQVDAI